MYYLNSYNPLCYYKQGREAIKKFYLAPFLDASCRREPDFQNPLPSISALCRGAGFAPRLREGDKIIYMTVKSRYLDEKEPHWRLVAVLEVIKRFESHREAAKSYAESGLPIPNNCMVADNPHMPYEMTGGMSAERFGGATDNADLVKKWDSSYKVRSRKHGVFLTCRPIYLELANPAILTSEFLQDVFGRIPPTLTPPAITNEQYNELLRVTQRAN